MAIHGDHDQAPALTERSSENSGLGDGEADLAGPPAPNRNRAPTVGGRRVSDPKVEQSELHLPCPVCVGQPDRYATVTRKCIPGAKYKGLSKLNEHFKRVHSKATFCVACMTVLPKRMTREMHLETCEPRTLTPEEKETYPTFLPEDVLFRVLNWKSTVTAPKNHREKVVHRWKHLFEIINPGQDIPDPLLTSLRRSPEPSIPHSPALREKRRASSSPDGNSRGPRRRQDSPEPQTADKGAEAVGFEPAPVSLIQPQPCGHSGVPFEGQPHGYLLSPYNVDHNGPRPCTVAPDAPMHSIPTMDTKSIAQSETTAVTGLHPDTYAGSTAVSDTIPFLNHAHQLPKPSWAIDDDEDDNYGGFLDPELFAFEKKGTAMASGPYPANLESERDLMAMTSTMDTPQFLTEFKFDDFD